MDPNNTPTNQNNDPFFSISLDIQEIIDTEFKRVANTDNSWLCCKCGLLNGQNKTACECGEPNNGFTKDVSSDSESSFEIISEIENIPKQDCVDCVKIEVKKPEIWLCSICGVASSNKNCCQDLFKYDNQNIDDFNWECAWCFTKNNENYTKCKDCGHLRLDISSKKVPEVTKNEENNCWDPRKWFINDSKNGLYNQYDFSLSYTGEKLGPKIVNENIPNLTLTNNLNNQTCSNLKSLEMNLTTIDSQNTSVDMVDNIIKDSGSFELNKVSKCGSDNVLVKSSGIKNKVRFDSDKFMTNYTMVGKDLVLVERKSEPGKITIDMLQGALKNVSLSSDHKQGTGGANQTKPIIQNQKYKTNSSTQTEIAQESNFDNKKQNKWKCVQCKLINPTSTSYCCVCHRKRSEAKVDLIEDPIQKEASRSQKDLGNNKSIQVPNSHQLDKFSEFANSIVKDTSNQAYSKIQKQKYKNKNRNLKSHKNKFYKNINSRKTETIHSTNFQNKRRAHQTVSNPKKVEENLKTQKQSAINSDFQKTQPSNISLLLDKSFDLGYSWICQNCKLSNPGNLEKCTYCNTDSLPDLSDIFDEKNNFKKSTSTVEMLQKFLGHEIAQMSYHTSQKQDGHLENRIENQDCQFQNLTTKNQLNQPINLTTKNQESQPKNLASTKQDGQPKDLTANNQDCQHNVTKNEAKSYWDPRKWFFKESIKVSESQNDSTSNEVSEKLDPKSKIDFITTTEQNSNDETGANLYPPNITISTQENILNSCRCPIYTFLNQAQLLRCRDCQEKKPEKPLILTKTPNLNQRSTIALSSSNQINSSQMESCLEEPKPDCHRSGASSLESNQNVPKSTWKCTQCSLQSSVNLKDCLNCDASSKITVPKSNLPNPEQSKCEIEETVVQNIWICSQCNMKNSEDFPNCNFCYRSKDAPVEQNVPYTEQKVGLSEENEFQNTWIFPQCSIKNCGKSTNCNFCYRLKDATVEQYAPKMGQKNVFLITWDCTRCTAENDGNCEICNICGYPKKALKEQNVPKQEQVSSSGSHLDSESWVCEVCTLINSVSTEKCSTCFIPRTKSSNLSSNQSKTLENLKSNTKWKCLQCTYVNEGLVSECSVCGQNKSPKTFQNLENKIWTCTFCTLENPEQNVQCSVCENNKTVGCQNVRQDGRNQDGRLWICQKCTYENSSDQTVCFMCNTGRNNAIVLRNAQNVWKCSVCTLENSTDFEICSACNNNKNTTPPNSLTFNSWTCQQCASKNVGDFCETCYAIKQKQFANVQLSKTINKSTSCTIITERTQQSSSTEMKTHHCNTSKSNLNLENCTSFSSFKKSLTTDGCEKNVSKNVDSIILTKSNEELLLSNWRCNVCTFLNSDNRTHCRTCKTGRDGKHNVEKNEDNSKKVPMVQSSSPNKDQIDDWKCHLCTLLNSYENNKCRACYTDRVIAKPMEICSDKVDCSPQGPWTCQFCNAKNKEEYLKCRNCHKMNLLKLPFSSGEEEDGTNKWKCIACTYDNSEDKVECSLCSHSRIKIIDCEQEIEEKSNKKPQMVKDNTAYLELVEASNAVLVPNTEAFYCIICMTNCDPGEGVVLSECLHQFCRDCLKGTISNGEEQGAHILCPYVDDTYRCEAVLMERELRHIVDEEIYERHLAAALREAKAALTGNENDHVYQCRTADCIGWCTYEDGVNNFWCQACFKINCLNCQAIHEDETCAQYQDRIQTEARTNDEAHQTNEQLQNLLATGEAMKCPSCGIILAKRSGCDWLVCSSCRTEICWATRGPRWGPNGRGDTSGGCRCRENGQLCHPSCGNCH